MAREEAEPTNSAGEDAPDTQVERPRTGKRQRAADLFSPHRYRALQLSAFERKRRGDTVEPAAADWEDDAADPPLMSDAPAARAAREVVPGTVHRTVDGLLSPVPLSPATDEESVAVADVDTRASSEAEWATDHSEDRDDGDFPTEVIAGTDYASPDRVADAEDADADADADAGDGETIEETKPPRVSRNFFVATAVGLALLGATLASAWYHPTAFAVLLYGFCIAAIVEWKRALQRHGRRVPAVPLIAATIGLGVATHFAKPEGLVVALLVGCAGVVAWRIGDERMDNTLADSLAGVLTLLWIPFLASFLYLLELADSGWERVVIVVLAVVGNDTGALVFGMVFGKHKLLERVSPAKTWEGALGGVAVGTIAASVAAWFYLDGGWYIGAAVGAASAVAAIIGDLAESSLKRDIQVKDMSHALPGHGGILDRIDSLLFAAPVGYVVFAIFLGTLGGGGL